MSVKSSKNPLHITMPWYGYRFRLRTHAVGVMLNVEDVDMDYVAKTIKINVRATINPQHYVDALSFADRSFCLDAMDGAHDNAYFSLQPSGLELTAHDFTLAYGKSQTAMHRYTFTFESMDVIAPEPTPVPEIQAVEDDGFLTPAEALRSYEEQQASKKELTSGRQLLNEDDDFCPRDTGC